MELIHHPWRSGVDVGPEWAYKRGPSGVAPMGGALAGLLIEIVEKMGRDARTAAEGRLMFVHLRTFGGPYFGSVREDGPGLNLRV